MDFPKAGIKCQLLRIDHERFKGWTLGKLRIQSSIKLINKRGTSDVINISSMLEFCPDNVMEFYTTYEETSPEKLQN